MNAEAEARVKEQLKDPWDPINQTVLDALVDFNYDAEHDYVPISAALSKYSSLLEVLSFNRERTSIEEMQTIVTNSHRKLMAKLARAELHIELTGTTPRLPR